MRTVFFGGGGILWKPIFRFWGFFKTVFAESTIKRSFRQSTAFLTISENPLVQPFQKHHFLKGGALGAHPLKPLFLWVLGAMCHENPPFPPSFHN